MEQPKVQQRYIRRFGPTEWGQRRAASHLSLRDLERLTGINRGYLSMLERGRYLPSPDETRRILDALDGAMPAPVE
jgi:predicted transcriptional regulator